MVNCINLKYSNISERFLNVSRNNHYWISCVRLEEGIIRVHPVNIKLFFWRSPNSFQFISRCTTRKYISLHFEYICLLFILAWIHPFLHILSFGKFTNYSIFFIYILNKLAYNTIFFIFFKFITLKVNSMRM